jgi:hypothetical protein
VPETNVGQPKPTGLEAGVLLSESPLSQSWAVVGFWLTSRHRGDELENRVNKRCQNRALRKNDKPS